MIKLFCVLKECGLLTSIAFEGTSKALESRLIRPVLLRVLWREQHPDAHEQTALDFSMLGPPAQQTSFWKVELNH